MKILCLLQNAWGDTERLPDIFRPNILNKSAKVIKKIVGDNNEFYFCNTTGVVTKSANIAAKADHEHLKRVLNKCINYNYDLLLICGKQAERAFNKVTNVKFNKPFMYIPHPACRNLSNIQIKEINNQIRIMKFYGKED